MVKNRGAKKDRKAQSDTATGSSISDSSAMNDEPFGLDPLIVFRVQGVLFGIVRSQLMASEVFRDMLNDEHLGDPKEGTEEKPIEIEKISKVTLSQVKAFYKVINCRRFDAEPTLSVTQWSEALQLATTWGFEALRKAIIAHLDAALDDPLRRIEIADRCEVKEWLHPAYAKLCAQETPLTVKEGRLLGFERFAALCRIREQELRTSRSDYRCGQCNDYYDEPPKGYRGYGFTNSVHTRSEVTDCQAKCCRPTFQLNAQEQVFLELIKQADDL